MPKRFKKSPMTRIQVADELGISTSTLKRKLQKAGIEILSGLIFRSDLKKIEQFFYSEEDEEPSDELKR